MARQIFFWPAPKKVCPSLQLEVHLLKSLQLFQLENRTLLLVYTYL